MKRGKSDLLGQIVGAWSNLEDERRLLHASEHQQKVSFLSPFRQWNTMKRGKAKAHIYKLDLFQSRFKKGFRGLPVLLKMRGFLCYLTRPPLFHWISFEILYTSEHQQKVSFLSPFRRWKTLKRGKDKAYIHRLDLFQSRLE